MDSVSADVTSSSGGSPYLTYIVLLEDEVYRIRLERQYLSIWIVFVTTLRKSSQVLVWLARYSQSLKMTTIGSRVSKKVI